MFLLKNITILCVELDLIDLHCKNQNNLNVGYFRILYFFPENMEILEMARGFVNIDTRTISLTCKQETSRAGYLVLSKTKSLSRKGCHYREGVAVLAVGTVYLFIIKQ